MSGWTTPADIRAAVRRRWDDGSLLRAFAADAPFPSVEVPLRRPAVGEVGDDLAAVRNWIAAVDAGAHHGRRYTVTTAAIGGRHLGRNELPSRAVISRFEQAWSLLDVHAEVVTFQQLRATAEVQPAVWAWITAHPLRALELAGSWPALVAAFGWLDDHRGSGRYLREIDAPGVDTKLVERHRAVLAPMLGVHASGPGFVADLGLRVKPELVRLRPDESVGLAPGFSELAARREELARARPRVRTALVVENEITYLTVPVPAGGVVIWGKGFEVDRAGSLPWLEGVDVRYWGDLDTHGFAILDRLRAWLPQTRSVLMDRATLLGHRDRWGTEPAPTRARLSHLGTDEAALYADLVTDRFGSRVRLEQERVDWAWVLARLAEERRPAAGSPEPPH